MFFSERVKIGDALHQSALEQLLHHGFTQSFDVHNAARTEVQQRFAQLGGAVGIDAAPVHFTFGADYRIAALGTVRRKRKPPVPARMFCVFDHLRDFGNDIAAALHFEPSRR